MLRRFLFEHFFFDLGASYAESATSSVAAEELDSPGGVESLPSSTEAEVVEDSVSTAYFLPLEGPLPEGEKSVYVSGAPLAD